MMALSDKERRARSRRREKRREFFTPVDAPYDGLCALIEAGYLSEDEAEDKERRGRAIAKFLADFAKKIGVTT